MPQAQSDPRLVQWEQRRRAAMAQVQAAEQSGDPARVRQAYDQLRTVQTARPGRSAQGGGDFGGQRRQSASPAPQREGGIVNYIKNALSGGK